MYSQRGLMPTVHAAAPIRGDLFYFAGKRFFLYIYDVIVKQKIKKRSVYHYSWKPTKKMSFSKKKTKGFKRLPIRFPKARKPHFLL
jgi:hypothetical protein